MVRFSRHQALGVDDIGYIIDGSVVRSSRRANGNEREKPNMFQFSICLASRTLRPAGGVRGAGGCRQGGRG